MQRAMNTQKIETEPEYQFYCTLGGPDTPANRRSEVRRVYGQ